MRTSSWIVNFHLVAAHLNTCINVDRQHFSQPGTALIFSDHTKWSNCIVARVFKILIDVYSKTCLKRPLKKKTKYWFSRQIIP